MRRKGREDDVGKGRWEPFIPCYSSTSQSVRVCVSSCSARVQKVCGLSGLWSGTRRGGTEEWNVRQGRSPRGVVCGASSPHSEGRQVAVHEGGLPLG